MLGEPLRASIAFALNPEEALYDYCIFLKPGLDANGLPSIGHATVAVSSGTIRLTGQSVLKEPLLSLQLSVDCPNTPRLSREYSVFLSPWLPSQEASTAVASDTPAVLATESPAVLPAPVPEISPTAESRSMRDAEPRRAVASAPANRGSIATTGSYRVQPGDTLSGIAERLSGRSVGIWEAVDVIFAANPDAFIHNNRNLLKAGALLELPATLGATGSAQVTPPPAIPVRAKARSASPSPASSTYDGYRDDAPGGESAAAGERRGEPVGHAVPSQIPANVSRENRNESEVTSPDNETTSPRSGAVSVATDGNNTLPIDRPIERTNEHPIDVAQTSAEKASPFAAPTGTIRDTSIEIPAPAQSGADVRSDTTRNGDPGNELLWLKWLSGSGIALILALLVFGRTLRARFAPDNDAVADEATPRRRKTDGGNVQTSDTDVDFQFDQPDSSAQVIALDGDLDAGTGFQECGDIVVAEDFGFSATGDFQLGLDVDFTAESSLDDQETDIIPLGRDAEEPLIVSELPTNDDPAASDFDLPVDVDAIRQPSGGTDETTRGLHAIELDARVDEQTNDEADTVSEEIDYKILEQDYEDELTATQALSAELAKAAQELIAKKNDATLKDAYAESPTAEFATLGADLTAELPQADDDERTIERTANMPADARNQGPREGDDADVNDGATTGMRAADNDATAVLGVEPTTLDTRKKKAS